MTGSASLQGSAPVSGLRAAMVLAVAVAALGYFVDVFDILLFSVVRVASLRDLGVPPGEQLGTGLTLLSIQNAGLMIGGILFGIYGDRSGRRSVLFGSILLYSLGNLANALVHSVPAYAACRFVAGLGLAGELGAGVTLVSELMPTRKRGYGTAIIASVGLAGGLVAPWVGTSLPWRTAYVVGGVAGLTLLGLRLAVHESPLFRSVEKRSVPRGNLLMLFGSRARLWRYLRAFLTGLPIWYAIGILISLAPEVGKGLGVSAPIAVAPALFNMYLGFVVGDISSGLLSQALRSRRAVMLIYLVLLGGTVWTMLGWTGLSPSTFYALCIPLGIGAGYWVLFVTSAAEQFGTNLRATVATSISNLVRGAIIPIAALFHALVPSLGIRGSAGVVGAVCVGVAIAAVLGSPETFDRDLDYLET
ncbi:MAG TPA: MFS transporter [Myxococcaceae bacterium]|nr:MFS transporter [Myxococcaceae bacterium]